MESSEINWDEAVGNVIQNWRGSLESYELTEKCRCK